MKKKLLQPNHTEVIKSRDFGRLRGTLTRNQRVAFAAFVKNAYLQMLKTPEQRDFEIPTSLLLDEMNIEHRNLFKGTASKEHKDSLESSLTDLMTKVLEWRYKVDGKLTVEKTTMLAGFKMSRETVEFSFSKWLHKRVLCYGNAYILEMPVIATLKSGYAVALYEQIEQRKAFQKWKISLEEFRELMGTAPDEYKEMKNFKARVVNPAIKELNEKTDYIITFDQEKNGRKITHLIFRWQQKEQPKPNPEMEKNKERIQELEALKGTILEIENEKFIFEDYLKQDGYYHLKVQQIGGEKATVKPSIYTTEDLINFIKHSAKA